MPRKHTPTKHTRFSPMASCSAKRKFASEQAALKALEMQELLDMQLELQTYKCAECGGWHLTRSTNKA
jgi:hypothetical protein